MFLASTPMKSEDHRTRAGAYRREKMRSRLIESALLVFARRGVEGSVIDEVITTAEVSRGTFYNYFRTNEELLTAVAQEVGNQMLEVVDPVVREHTDPAVRVACGVRLTLMVARAHPHLAAFIGRVGPPALGAQSLVTEYLPRDLADGMAEGIVAVKNCACGQANIHRIGFRIVFNFHSFTPYLANWLVATTVITVRITPCA